MRLRWAPGLMLAATLAGFAPPASADPGQPATRSDREHGYAALGKTCRSELDRFCPDVGPGQFHSMAICLKPFSSNLSLGCRAALRNTMSDN